MTWINSATSLTSAFLITLIGFSCAQSTDSPATQGSCDDATIGAAAINTTSSTNTIDVYIADPHTTGTIWYPNEPLVSVTICSPNHSSASQCQTISNILLDTGSFGLRVFKSAIHSNVSLSQQKIAGFSSYDLASCAVFGSGADWGPIKNGDIILGNQTATNIPIHVIDSTYSVMPSDCRVRAPDTDPCTTGFNGILGVGLFAQDCGAACANSPGTTHGGYFLCNSAGCGNISGGNPILIPLAQQVTNPVSKFSAPYNNGISITLPSLSVSGGAQIHGTMTIGIPNSGVGVVGTPNPAAYPAATQSLGLGSNFFTTIGGFKYGTLIPGSSGPPVTADVQTYAFIDSGSNGLFFPTQPGLTNCTTSPAFFCASSGSTVALSATMEGYSGAPTASVNFTISNADPLFASSNSAFGTIGGNWSNAFDWGLPFFFGRTVYVGLEGKTATFNSVSKTGPYWAF